MIRYKFSKEINQEFGAVLRERVNELIRSTDSDQLLTRMIVKSVVILSLYIVPFLVILFAGIESIPLLFILWMVMGLGKAFVGTAVMHDALHGSYSKYKNLNNVMEYTAFLIGVYPMMWKLQHNVLHHTYTNIEHADEDIESRYVLRFSPHQPRYWFHRVQQIYAPLFYCLTTLIWMTAKDYVKLFNYKKKELIKSKKDFWMHFAGITVTRIMYFTVLLIIPILVLPFSGWITFAMFLSMHAVTGLSLTLIFQTAHVMPTSSFLDQETPVIEENWLVHQLMTTSNYAMNNRVITWLFGGLNFQVEHHLFPNICHLYYPAISKIVQQTTAEYGLPYYYQPTFLEALHQHFVMLKSLGRQTEVKSASVPA